jgi:hypothetical protein
MMHVSVMPVSVLHACMILDHDIYVDMMCLSMILDFDIHACIVLYDAHIYDPGP